MQIPFLQCVSPFFIPLFPLLLVFIVKPIIELCLRKNRKEKFKAFFKMVIKKLDLTHLQ